MSTLQVFKTEKPSTVIFSDDTNDQFFIAYTRGNGILRGVSTIHSMLNDVIDIDKGVEKIDPRFGSKHFVKLRSILVDNKHADYTLYVDYLHDKDYDPIFTKESLQQMLNNGNVVHDGQCQWVEVKIISCLTSSDSFNPISDEYYR